MAETYGKDEYQKIETRRHAQSQARDMYEDHYEQGQGAEQYDPNQYQPHERIQNNSGGEYYTRNDY